LSGMSSLGLLCGAVFWPPSACNRRAARCCCNVGGARLLHMCDGSRRASWPGERFAKRYDRPAPVWATCQPRRYRLRRRVPPPVLQGRAGQAGPNGCWQCLSTLDDTVLHTCSSVGRTTGTGGCRSCCPSRSRESSGQVPDRWVVREAPGAAHAPQWQPPPPLACPCTAGGALCCED
jgi:hypothetical protein